MIVDVPIDRHLYDLWQRRAAMPLNISRVSVSGLNFIPADGPAILAPNHHNWKDIFFIAAIVKRPIYFAATIELFDYSLCRAMLDHYFGQFIKGKLARLPMKWMNRNERAKEHLKQGKLLCVFPEGGTARPGNLRRFKLGAAKLLYDLKKENYHRIPVLPIGIGGTFSIALPGRRLFFRVGKPLYIDDYLSSKMEKHSLRIFSDQLQNRVWHLIHKTIEEK